MDIQQKTQADVAQQIGQLMLELIALRNEHDALKSQFEAVLAKSAKPDGEQ